MFSVFSAKGDFDEALQLCEQTLLEYPENLPLLALRARLEEQIYGGDVALRTARYMFNLLRDLGEISASSTDSGIGHSKFFF